MLAGFLDGLGRNLSLHEGLDCLEMLVVPGLLDFRKLDLSSDALVGVMVQSFDGESGQCRDNERDHRQEPR